MSNLVKIFQHLLLMMGVIVIGNCGILTDKTESRIVGGEQVKIEQFPFQVSVQYEYEHICGGSIIGRKWILTAAHCTHESKLAHFSVRVGSSRHASGGTRIKVSRVIQHKNYSPSTVDMDFSLLQLRSSIPFNSVQQPIKLPDHDEVFPDELNCTVSGWGDTMDEDVSNSILRAATVEIINYQTCNESYEALGGITNNMLCAGFMEGGIDSCFGDSGGPLVFGEGNSRILVGVVSWGEECARSGYPGVYAKVTAIRDWIKKNTGI